MRSSLSVFALASYAQEAEESWRDLVTRGQHAAGDKEYARAEQLFLKAVHEAEYFGADDSRVGVTLESLGQVYGAEKKVGEAESVYHRALGILGKTAGDDSIEVASLNVDIGRLLYDNGRQGDALEYARKSLPVYERALGGTSVQTAGVLCLIGDSLRSIKNFGEAEAPLRRCADIRETDGGVDNIDLAAALHSLALTYAAEAKYELAEPRYKLAEKIRENKLGLTSPLLAQDHGRPRRNAQSTGAGQRGGETDPAGFGCSAQ